MTTRMSIGIRRTLWYSSVLAVGIALFPSAIWIATEHSFRAWVDQSLVERARGVIEAEMIRVADRSADTPRRDVKDTFEIRVLAAGWNPSENLERKVGKPLCEFPGYNLENKSHWR